MTWWQRLRGRGRLEDELDAELRFHFDRLVADSMAEGLSEEDARRRARAEFGGLEAIKDDCREARGTRWAHDFAQDVRYSTRLLLKERRVTLVAVLALALGIGVNNTQFTVVNAICIRGLPIAGVERLVDIAARDDTQRPLPLSRREFDDVRASRPAALESVAAYASRPAVLRDDQRAAERVTVAYLSTGALATIGEQPMLGRDFRSDEDRPGHAGVAILAARIWRSRYGADPAVVGSVVRINGTPIPVIGVMPDDFRFPDNADVWQPLAALEGPPDARQLKVYGRLSAGATIADAQAGLAGVLTHAAAAGDKNGAIRPLVVPLNERYNGDITNPAWTAFITVGIILVLISSSNVATLLLASGASRAREMAIRVSLGATRLRIVRQMLVESALLAGAGGLAAIAVSLAGLKLLAAAIPPGGLPYWITLTMDARVVGVLVAVCLGTVFLFGLAPALQLARTRPNAAIKETTLNASQDRGSARWTWVFLTAQLALTVMVLAKLDLTIEQYRANQASEPVLDAKRILTFGLTLADESYREPGRREAFYRNLRDRLTGSGQAVAVSVASAVPTAGRVRSIASGDQPFSASSPLVRTVAIDAAYFQTVGLTVVQGRSFATNSATDERTGLVVNQRFVDLFLPGGTPVGRSIRLGSPPGAPAAPEEVRTVIGVVPSLREQPTAEPLPAAFVPLTPAALSSSVVLLRTEGDPAALPPVIREEVRKLDPEVPVTGLLTLEDVSWRARWNSRVSLRIITTIAFIALALATLGLASLTAYAVAQRRRELGIRLALGATPPGMVLLVLRRVLLQVVVGVVVGWIAAKVWDPETAVADIARASLVVAVVMVAVSSWPAARAGRIDPLEMLRDQ
jgi:putative ABC transport system permease protein